MNEAVTKFLDDINHPLRAQIEDLRKTILNTRTDIEENIKWNGPNYKVNEQDRVSIKVHPARSFHLILHIGAKVKAEPASRLLAEDYGIVTWKSNDRAVIDFKTPEDYNKNKPYLSEIVKNWFSATL